jgi:Zn-dependent protease with chaperone function
MANTLEYEVHSKEQVYFVLKVIAAVIGYGIIYLLIAAIFNSSNPVALAPILFYAALIIIYLFFRMGILTGFLMGNAVRVSEKQFPQIHKIVNRQSYLLGLSYLPEVYILQSGGALNAFAMRFFGADYVVLYSDVVEEALAEDINVLKFIIGHELGHIKRHHMTKSVLLFPGFIIPFLNSAYSRACEFTCDNIGCALSPEGTVPGLLILASGKKLWKEVNHKAFVDQEMEAEGFWFWFAEKISSHPRLTKRIGRFEYVERPDLQVAPDVLLTNQSE